MGKIMRIDIEELIKKKEEAEDIIKDNYIIINELENKLEEKKFNGLLIHCPACNRYPVSKTGKCPDCKIIVEEEMERIAEKLNELECELNNKRRLIVDIENKIKREKKRIEYQTINDEKLKKDEIEKEKQINYSCPACGTICKVILRGSKQMFYNVYRDKTKRTIYCKKCGHDITKTAPKRCRHDIICMDGEECGKCKEGREKEGKKILSKIFGVKEERERDLKRKEKEERREKERVAWEEERERAEMEGERTYGNCRGEEREETQAELMDYYKAQAEITSRMY